MILPKIHRGQSNPYIKKYWVIENSSVVTNKITDPMIPDGHLEILLIEGNGMSFKLENNVFNLSSGIYLIGQLKGKGELRLLAGTKAHFIKLYQWSTPLATNFSLVELTNKVIPFSELNKSLDTKLKRFHPSLEIDKIVEVLTLTLYDRSKINSGFNLIYGSCKKLITHNKDFRSIKTEILSDHNISDRTLENKFKQHVGLTPKQFSMTIRMRKIVEELMYDTTSSSLTNIAIKNGFFDQSHFIRSFKSIFNTSPGQLELDNYFIPNSKESFRYYTI